VKKSSLIEAFTRFGEGYGISISETRRRAATGAGAVALGLVAILFAIAGDWAQHRFALFQSQFPYAPLVLTPAIFVIAVFITHRWFPETRGSGIPQVIATAKSPETAYGPLLGLPVAAGKLLLTLLMLLGGASVGREGPTVQVSAAIMVSFHRLFKVPMTPGVIIAGGAAGVAAAFNTPLAGVAFAIEELAAAFEQRVALLVMAAVVISGLVSLGIAGDYVYFGVMNETLPVSSVIVAAPVAGIFGGICGGLFARILLAMTSSDRTLVRRLRSRPLLLAACCGLVVATVGILTGGSTWGTGYETTRHLIEGDGADIWFGPAKFAATLATALSGAPGGIFAPSLSVGAGFGQLLSFAFPDDPMGAIVLLGMTAYFVGVVRAPLTAVIILMEATAARGMLLPLFATAILADGASKLVCREKLYVALARSFINRAREDGSEVKP